MTVEYAVNATNISTSTDLNKDSEGSVASGLLQWIWSCQPIFPQIIWWTQETPIQLNIEIKIKWETSTLGPEIMPVSWYNSVDGDCWQDEESRGTTEK